MVSRKAQAKTTFYRRVYKRTSCITRTGDGTAVKSHLIWCHGQSAIQVFYKLFEGGSLRGHGMPAVSHHHVSEQRTRQMEREFKTHNIQNETFPTHFVTTNMSSQFVGACGGAIHAVALLQQFEQLLDRDTGIWGATQSKDLPEQHPKRPPRPEKRRPYIIFPIMLLRHLCILKKYKAHRWYTWLTRRSGGCRFGQIVPLEPSISLANAPAVNKIPISSLSTNQ